MSAASAPETLKSRVESALAQHVGPALEMDGTLLEVLDVTDGVARIRKQIDEHLLQLPGITPYRGCQRVQIQFGANVFPAFAAALHFHGLQ